MFGYALRNNCDGHPLKLEIHDQENSAEAAFINKNLAEFNSAQGFVANAKPLTIVFRNAKGEIVAGLSGSTSWQWLYTRILWVSQTERRASLGSRLMQAAETEALARGCRHAYVDTFSWQAREFYENQGYVAFAELKNFPPGNTRHFLRKDLPTDS